MSDAPVRPRVLVEPVLDRDDGEALREVAVEVDHLGRREGSPLAGKVVCAVVEHFACRRIERDRNALTVAGPLRRLENRLDRTLGRLEIRGETSFVSDGGREAAVMQYSLEPVVDLRADSKRI